MGGSGARRRARRAVPAIWIVLAIGGLAACAGSATESPGRTGPEGSTVSGAPDGSAVPSGSAGHPLRYVALGDSYTIGTSVTEPERWPNQLVGALGGDRAPLELVANLGVNGFTTADVIAVELPRIETLRPDVITLQIGVNDVVQGVSEATYRERLGQILAALRTTAPTARILCVTTPDYTVTPAGADYGDPATQRAAIRRFNEIFTQLSRSRGIAVVDIFDLSESAATDGTLVARDGLHPSGRQYGLWVGRIAPATRSLLGSPTP